MKHSDKTKELIEQHIKMKNELSNLEAELIRNLGVDILYNLKVGDYVYAKKVNDYATWEYWMRIDEVTGSHNPYKVSMSGPGFEIVTNKNGDLDCTQVNRRIYLSAMESNMEFDIIEKTEFATAYRLFKEKAVELIK